MIIDISLTLSALLTLFCSYRAVKGPSTEDRVVALDTISTNVVALSMLYAMSTEKPVFINIALLLAITGFTATAASSVYLREGELIR